MKHPDFAKRFRQAVSNAGVDDTQSALAKLFGVSGVSVWSWRNGEKLPRMSNAVLIAETLGVDVNWLLTGAGENRISEPKTEYVPLTQIPLLENNQIPRWIAGQDVDANHITTAKPISARGYAISLPDETRTSLSNQRIVAVDPSVPPVAGKPAIFHFPDYDETHIGTFKQRAGVGQLVFNDGTPAIEITEQSVYCGRPVFYLESDI